jgi:hypothetical protein
MNARLSTVTKTLVTLIANALGVPAKQLRVLASTLKMLLNFQELSLFVIKNKRKISFKKRNQLKKI